MKSRTAGLLALSLVPIAAGCASTSTPSGSGSPAVIERATLGVEAKSLTPSLRKKLKIPAGISGVLVTEILPDGPAALAGVRSDDVIQEVGNTSIRNICDFVGVAFDRAPGPVSIVLRRAESKFAADVGLTVSASNQDSLFDRACRTGSVGGCYRRAWSFAGSASAADRARSRDLYSDACTAGFAEACADHGLTRLREGDRESVGELERSCDRGSGAGCASFAFLYATGKFVAKDDRRAASLYAKSCDLGDAQGCYNAGLMDDDGRGVARDAARALLRYEEGCETGSPAACTNLGFLYEHGRGTRKDLTRAAALYERGCDGSRCQPPNRNGCVNLGRSYRDGTGVPRDPARAASLFRDACDRDVDPNDVGADENRSRACSLLGALYIDGDGVDKDTAKALQLSERGCDRGDSFGCFNAAAISGGGDAPDLARAASFLQRACDAGDGEGCFDLGIDYEKGRGVAEDRSRAAQLFRKACELGFSQACGRKSR